MGDSSAIEQKKQDQIIIPDPDQINLRGDQFIDDPRRYILRLKVPVSVISSVTLGFE